MGTLLNRRRYMGGGASLPYDAEVEYLQTTRGQGIFYIDLGFAADESTDAAEIDFQVIDYASQDRLLHGGGNSNTMEMYINGNGQYSFHRASSSNQWSPSTNTPVNKSLREVYKVDWLNNTYTIRGDTKSFTTNTTKQKDSSNLVLFTNASYNPSIRLYGVKFWRNGTLIRNMTPVVSNGVGYLYDKVTKQMFGNSGSGTFILPPNPSTMVRIDYIQSTGTQYIDTGINGKTGLTVEAKFVYDKAQASMLLGSVSSTSGSGNRVYLIDLEPSGNVRMWYIDQTIGQTALTVGNEYTVRSEATQNEQKFYVDGVLKATGANTSDIDNNVTLGLFCIHRTTATPNYTDFASVKLISCKIWDNDVLVRDFIPVRCGDVGYLYDNVTNYFYENYGTGSFILGSDKT